MRHFAGPAAAFVLLLAIITTGADATAVQKNDATGLQPGDVWTLVLLNDQGAIVRSLVVRVSDRPAASCRGGKWNALEILDDHPRSEPANRGEAGYEVSAKDISMDLSIGVCDAYRPLHGEISDLGIQGSHGTLGLGGARTVGRFYGMKVPPSMPGKVPAGADQ